jgi:GT2 family glycosyltransferase/2-polyprenyl-3-methyl-5-hydroxy-6-metoxy-1,4-benzoquinol methylase/glycosyltransferase involved in cell wall biosynthesis
MKPADRINSVQWWNDYFREEWERHGGPEQSRHFMQRIVDQLPPLDRAFLAEQAWSILDWGCAFGDGTAELARAFPRATVYGIEISSTALSRAAERFAGIRFLRATDDAPVGTLPRAFEVVVNSNSLEHFADPLDVLRRNLAATTMLHLSLVPYDEAPLSVHHLTRFDESWFPEVIDGFDRVLAKVVDVDPTYWPGGRQLLVAYASRAYRTQRCAFERGFDERLKWDNYYRELPLLEIDPQTQAFNDELVQLVRELLPQGGRILEAGCGGGNQSLALAQSGYEVTLLDFSGAALEYARRSFEKHSVRATYVQDDAFAQRAAEYDLVFNAGVLEHYTLEEQARFLRGMASRSRRYVLALIPNRGCYWYWLWRIKKAAAGDWPFGKEVPQTTLADAFDAAGLTYAGETYLGAAWSESFIESLDGIDEQSRRLLIRLHRSPIVPGISKGYLLAALGVVAGTAAPWATLTPARLSTGDIRRHEEWAAALADALAGTIAAENRVRSERLRSEAELDAARGAAREEIAARDRRLIEVQATLEAHVAEARAQNGQTEQKLAASQLETAAVRSDLAAARSLIEQLQMQLQQFSVELHAVHSSRGWRFILFVRRLRQRFLPRGSRREWLARKLFRAARAGLKSLRKAPKTPLSTAATAAQPPVEAAPPSLAAASGPNAPVELPPPDYRPPLRQYAVIVLPIIDFTFRFQRPQQLATQFAAAGHPVFYAAMTFAGATSVRRLAAGIDSVILGGPAANPYRDVLADDVAATMAADLLRLIRLRGVESSVCIVQLPFWAPLAKALRAQGRTPIVYDCMDDHAGFSTNTDEMTRLEAPLVADADLCVGSSQLLHDRLTAAGARTILVRNAADHAHFAAVPWRRCDDLDSAVIGYYGAIADWFDAALVAQIARLRPQWTIKLIGSTFSADLAPLQGLGNVELVGEQPYARLPELIENWSCCLIPFRRNPLTEATNPVKVYEMLAAGKPVVAVALPELAPLSAAGLVRLGATAEEFVAAIENEMRTDNESAVARRRAFAAANTWSDRYALLDREVRALFPLVSVVVVTYNNERMNRLCLDSLLRDTDWPNLEVIVVDNASSDGTPALLREFAQTDPRVKVILNDANLGFAAGNNVGANAAQGEYLCLLNNDTIVTGGWLSRLIEHLRVRPDLGLVGPVTNAIGNEAQIAISYAGVSELPAWADRWCAAHRGQLVDVPMLAFFCVALRRSVWHQIGGLDERFGKGMFEDDDYNRRIRAAGLRVQLARDSFVHHWQKASFRLLGEQEYLRIYHENRRRFRIKWSEPNEAPADVAHKLAPLRQRAAAGKGTVVFPPSVGWSIDLFQRPHHLARVLAQDGYAVVFDCSTSYDSVDVIKQIEPGLFLFKGESEWLAGLPNLILWTFSYNYDYRDRYPERARVIYDWIDDLKVFPYDQEVLRELHARAMKEADVVAAVARPLHELALKERADAIYLPNAVEAARFEREPTPNAARSPRGSTTRC